MLIDGKTHAPESGVEFMASALQFT